jgi:hypothetical protein
MGKRDANDVHLEGGPDAVRSEFDRGAEKPKPAEPQETRDAARQRLVPIPWSKIHSLPRREPMIAGLLDRGGMSVVFGASGSCKTFFCLDLSIRKALGAEWRGKKLDQGAVAYIAAEGGIGIADRLDAYRNYHKVKTEDVPLYIFPEPIDLCHSDADVKLLVRRILDLPQQPAIELVVVDTLSRALAGGDENGPRDMGAFIRNLDQLRLLTKAHALVIHHTGRDESRGARGHASLKAAADTEIELSMDETTKNATATVRKQRDRVGGEEFGFRLQSVDIGKNSHGEASTSCVIFAFDAAPRAAPGGRKKLSDPQRLALEALTDCLTEKGKPPPEGFELPAGLLAVQLEDWKQEIFRRTIIDPDSGNPRQTFIRLKEGLLVRRFIGARDKIVWLVAPPNPGAADELPL